VTDQELQRAIQYVTAQTSYDRDVVAAILRAGLGELAALAASSSRVFDRDTLLEYVSRWTMSKTGYAEPQVREVLGCAGRWLDAMCDAVLNTTPPVGEP
jgi:hypothetical protein